MQWHRVLRRVVVVNLIWLLHSCQTFWMVHYWVWLLQVTLERCESWVRCFGINVTQSEVGRAENHQPLLSFKFCPQPSLQHIRFFLDNSMPINFNNFLPPHRTENFFHWNGTHVKCVVFLTTRTLDQNQYVERLVLVLLSKETTLKTSFEWPCTLEHGWSIFCWKQGVEVL